ncbi:hypothetical protein ROHU_013929 [Labeo rohita]|uniref:Uncharacterized protein n=1 Tax=Labeo rohita TaxID=84645 RepID=A0A498P3N5_LABRO|nr:hypothetical protein ROHU_013929 [Labeo rohita]
MFKVIVTVPGLPPGAIAGICASIALLVAAAIAAGVVIYFRHKFSELKKLIGEISEKKEQPLTDDVETTKQETCKYYS